MISKGYAVLLVMTVCSLFLCGCKEQQDAAQVDFQGSVKNIEDKYIVPATERKKVLVLHSYDESMQWIKDVNKGIIAGLAEEYFFVDKNVTIEYFDMDTKRQQSQEWKDKISRKAIAKIKAWMPDVVIATDDNAQSLVVEKMKDSGIKFVFLGVNADPEDYNYIDNRKKPSGNITGALERARFVQTVDFLRKLVGTVKKVAIVSNKESYNEAVIKRIFAAVPEASVTITAQKNVTTFAEWQNFIKSIQGKVDALAIVDYQALLDEKGQAVPGQTVLNWTVDNSTVPDFGFWRENIMEGLLCSEAISGYQQGHYAATVAAYVLMGQSPGEFAINTPQRGELAINTARAKILNINIPEDVERTATLFTTIGNEQ